MTKSLLILCLGLCLATCFASTSSVILTTKDSKKLHPIYQEECETLCLADPERCHTDCKKPSKAAFEKTSIATATLLKDGNVEGGLGDCNLWSCDGNYFQLCCPQPGVVPHQPCIVTDCEIGPVCSCS